MIDGRLTLSSYMTELLSAGQVSFARDEAIAALGITPSGFLKAAARLQRRGTLLNPRHGFYVVVPPQYLSWKAPPPSWYIDELMRHEGHSYYVGLLKAAELHGGTHQAVMEFQVVTDKRMPKLRAGRSIISFFYRKDMERVATAIVPHKTDTGSMKISSPELTALDLLRYRHATGTLDSITTVLSDLAAKLRPEPLATLAPAFERACIQRLGYLLDYLKQPDRAALLHEYLQKSRPLPWIELEPNRRHAKSSEPLERSSRWNVIVRRLPELDE
ncbi:MAG: type IV toxin-antitoxin system AbiEi family antitoxin [Xanthobacteraceae bacterium]|nr:type IV toxin-antitoxin system AbiEi family antitoxin [Xanthobacteraceae bacterium]